MPVYAVLNTLGAMVAIHAGIPPDQQRLTLRGAMLEDSRTVASYRLQEGDELQLSVSLATLRVRIGRDLSRNELRRLGTELAGHLGRLDRDALASSTC